MNALTEYYKGGKVPVEEEAKAITLRTEIKTLLSSTMTPPSRIEEARALGLAALPGAVPENHPRYEAMVNHPTRGIMLYPVFDHMTMNYDIYGWRAIVIEGCHHLGMGETPEGAITDLRRYLKFRIEQGHDNARVALERAFPEGDS